ncbi:hypothetical protein [Streptomyces sp. NPDC097610]|uniref:hypothetical protein n=1 Tax=Streptomyces sp. NPDC097610 TaxID=3157227 RepID=UPI003317CC0B
MALGHPRDARASGRLIRRYGQRPPFGNTIPGSGGRRRPTRRTPSVPQTWRSFLHITHARADELNNAARFLPRGPNDPDTLPCVENGGAQVYAYWEPLGLCVSLQLDSGDIPETLLNHGKTVPVRITVNGHDVFAAL